MCSVPTGGTGARKALDTCIKGMRGQRVLALGLVVYARALGWESGNRGCPPDSTDSFSWSHLLKTSWFQSCVCVCVCVCSAWRVLVSSSPFQRSRSSRGIWHREALCGREEKGKTGPRLQSAACVGDTGRASWLWRPRAEPSLSLTPRPA